MSAIPTYRLDQNDTPDLPIHIYTYVNNEREMSPMHQHSFIQINYVVSGRLHHHVNDSVYEIATGDIFVIPPYVPHQITLCDDEPYELIELEFSEEFILGANPNLFHELDGAQSIFDFAYIEPFLVTERNVRPRLNLHGKQQIQVESLLDEIHQEFDQKEDSFLLAIKADVLKLLVVIGRAFHENIHASSDMELFDYHRDAMNESIAFIDAHYQEDIILEDAARRANLSKSYFSYLFKSLTGKTFIQYIHALRIHKAMECLKTTNLLISDVCFDVGFNNINHFNRIFKRETGLSPSQYRVSSRRSS